MYLTKSKEAKFKEFLSKDDFEKLYLYDKISMDNLQRMLKESDIYNVSVDYNSYGEFLFVTFIWKDMELSAYGLGIHEHRNIKYLDDWELFSANPISKTTIIPYAEVEKAIQERYKEVKNMKTPEQDDYSNIYNFIADITDDDAAMFFMEELY